MQTNTENTSLSKTTVSFGLSLAVASVMNALLVVAKEKIPAVTTALQRMTGNHWISHAIVILVIFAALGWIFARINGGLGIRIPANRLTGLLVAGIVGGGVIIFGFYLMAD
jgi:hypothetical protein